MFPDVPEAITQGDGEIDARAMAEEALGMALLTYPLRGLPLPRPKTRRGRSVPVAPAADVAAKLAVLDAVRASGMTKTDFANLIGKDQKEARRILDPRHPTKLLTLMGVLSALGKRLVVDVEDSFATVEQSSIRRSRGRGKPSGGGIISLHSLLPNP